MNLCPSQHLFLILDSVSNKAGFYPFLFPSHTHEFSVLFLSAGDQENLLTIKNKEILFGSASAVIDNLDDDFKWHFLAVTWAADANVMVIRDFTASPGNSVGISPPQDM